MGGYWYVDSQPYSAVLDALIAASNSSQIVLTTGTYSDPGFIASLAASKITGTLGKSQQHAQTAYYDAAGTWDQAQTFNNATRFKTGTWHTSTEGTPKQRFYFDADGATYFQGHGSTPIVLRNGSDENIVTISSTGGATFGGVLRVGDTAGKPMIAPSYDGNAAGHFPCGLVVERSSIAIGLAWGMYQNDSTSWYSGWDYASVPRTALMTNFDGLRYIATAATTATPGTALSSQPTTVFSVSPTGAVSAVGNVDAPAFTAIASGVGSTSMSKGGATQTGYFSWFKPNGTRHTYVGYDTGNDLSFINEVSGGFSFNGPITSTSIGKLGDFTVATLPSAASNTGYECNVTDSSVTTFGSTVAGGGSSRVKVYSNGTNWTVQAA